ncbi:MAG: HAMP domain-containing histidine kinase [Mojavia pulchra JT2-VF2]|jgi:signal transduction histidine kinase|uniref:histidine kinase n=1 Tax=Mojavia pulchra JT2-VF2 TaxID=287848 RepID=A0A951UFS6_9NOST|nr:HAMP domain-containing histidine kinase [Mojavia pulchra JT2-VF2]
MQLVRNITALFKLPKISKLTSQEFVPETQLNHQGWISRRFSRLNISQKIALGYAVAMGVAVVGTATGFTLGDYYQRQALLRKEQEFKEVRLVNNLETTLLQVQTHQHKLIILTDLKLLQQEYSHLFEHTAELNELWSEIQADTTNKNYQYDQHDEGLRQFLQNYAYVPKAYSQQIRAILQQIDPSTWKSENISIFKKQLLEFTNGPLYLKLHQASDALEEVVEASYKELEDAEAAVQAAQRLREQIISASIMLSVAIAILLASYTSRAIAHPLEAVTNIAEKVTQESDFSLQAPLTTTDEVGKLATSFNQLIQRVNTLLEEQKAEASQQLIQSEKMSSLGRMLAGVAHEINNPVNFIYGNIQHTSAYFRDLLDLLVAYEAKASDDVIQNISEEIDLEFLREDLPKLLQSMEVGATRAKEIVLSLKNFSRLDETELHPVDLHACIDSTLLILNNRTKKGLSIIRDYKKLPSIEGYAGSLYQVFMNILSNAMDALESQDDLQASKEIVITTQHLEENWVLIKIADNGPGISQEHQTKIFEAFFTTKPIGIGTGLGLSISHQIVVEKHGGKLSCESEVGKGTTFAIALPIKHQTINKASTQMPIIASSLS